MEENERIHDWVVDGPLGRGGMATVWRVHSRIAPRLKGALKITDPVVHDSARGRFLREVDALARLRHHGVVRVLSAGELDDGRMYLVMELIEGEDLLHKLQKGALSWRDALRAFREVADGLRHAHSVGIHHRDLKPANVMITKDGGGCLVDFGIALDLEASRLTRAGTIPGTVTYMAPELLSVDSRDVAPGPADVYSLGQVLCESLTGRRCFDLPAGTAGLVRLVRQKHSSGPLDPGEPIPTRVRELVCRLTDSNPARRPSMAQVVRLLDAALSPDASELKAIDEATRIRRSLDDADEDSTQWPFDKATEEQDPDEERTLVMKIVADAEQRRRKQAAAELAAVAEVQSDVPSGEYSLAEPELPHNAVVEDEEVVQAFDSAAIMGELRAERARVVWQRVLVGMAVGVLLSLVAGLGTGVGLAVYFLR